MGKSASTVIFEAKDGSVVLFQGDTTPSLVLSADVASSLCELLNAAIRSTTSIASNPKTLPIQELCSRLEEVLGGFGRGIIEWQATLPLEPEAKLAAVELLSAARALDKF